ncbi:MAG: NAD(P)-dependent oxidoreductase [Candidatus Omnitrophota bacterium]
MKDVLVIGGGGFIGSHLAKKLNLQGYNVTVLARRNPNQEFIKSFNAELRSGDLLEPGSLKNALVGIDTVFCAVNIKPSGKNTQEYERELYLLHTNGTRNLIEACKFHGIKRIIYFSSVAAMGYKKGVNIYDESCENNPIDAYGKAKLEAENILNRSAKAGEIDVTILRPPGVFGENSLGVLNRIVFFAKKGFIPIIGSGKERQSITYVGNVVNQAILAANNISSIGRTYITTDNIPYSVNEIVDTVIQALGMRPLKIYIPFWFVMLVISFLNICWKVCCKKELMALGSILAISQERIFDGARIFHELGYQQEYDLRTGVMRTIEWYKKKCPI